MSAKEQVLTAKCVNISLSVKLHARDFSAGVYWGSSLDTGLSLKPCPHFQAVFKIQPAQMLSPLHHVLPKVQSASGSPPPSTLPTPSSPVPACAGASSCNTAITGLTLTHSLGLFQTERQLPFYAVE